MSDESHAGGGDDFDSRERLRGLAQGLERLADRLGRLGITRAADDVNSIVHRLFEVAESIEAKPARTRSTFR